MVEAMANLRPRSAGVTAAATLALMVCVTALLFWGYVLLAAVNAPADGNGKHIYQTHPLFFLAIVLIPSSLIAIGMRTAIGLLQLKPWARIAAMIGAIVALVLSLSIIAFRPFETFFISDRFVGPAESLRQLMAIAFVIVSLPVSVWWLFLFRMKSVKAQFASGNSNKLAV
jgi:hypothetical protein